MSQIQLFGILNVTPDSFSDGGEFLDTESAVKHAEQMFTEGADYIDIGGQSTRPNAVEISWEEEWKRVEPVLKKLSGTTTAPSSLRNKISLDTFHWQTAQKFLTFGGRILNDVSGFQDPRMQELVPQFDMVVVNHFPGKTVQEVHEQNACLGLSGISSINQVRDELLTRKEDLVRKGGNPENIVLDPGIGFGKTMELNWELLEFARAVPEERVMIGHSRKRFLGEHRFEIEPNLEAGKKAIDAGASFLRVHDVREHRAMIQTTNDK
ncbi:dihydropteroate synthase [Candidatus Gracilibacteria bacterium]|nr:dihydropteroate synthase [Candidatus Gracilibacteria bacterium]